MRCALVHVWRAAKMGTRNVYRWKNRADSMLHLDTIAAQWLCDVCNAVSFGLGVIPESTRIQSLPNGRGWSRLNEGTRTASQFVWKEDIDKYPIQPGFVERLAAAFFLYLPGSGRYMLEPTYMNALPRAELMLLFRICVDVRNFQRRVSWEVSGFSVTDG